MQVIGKGGVEIGELTLNDEGRRLLGQLAYDDADLRIAFDFHRAIVRDMDTGNVGTDEVVLTRAAIVPNG